MGPQRTRREFLGMATMAGIAAAAAGCARPGGGGGSSGSGPVTVKHLFGETTVPGPPTRVVSAGLTEQDDLLAVGVRPVAVTRWFGDESGLWSWQQSTLGGDKPIVLSLDNGIQVEAIARLKPDLIVAVNAGLDSDTYRKLSEIAPTIAQRGADAFFEPWKQQAGAVGEAVYKGDQMNRILDAVEEKFTAVAQANPGFADRPVALMNVGNGADPLGEAVSGWRTEFLTAMGFQVVDAGQADAVIWCTDSEEQRSTLAADPEVVKLKSSRNGRNVFTTRELAGAIAYASPLSYPLVAEQLPPLLAKALS
ncbi:MAG: ABC transporter substrate-binding protein [Mycobacterium sp.]|nr:ABC transporter substrate-binding protein [Mycobacterium sp.]